MIDNSGIARTVIEKELDHIRTADYNIIEIIAVDVANCDPVDKSDTDVECLNGAKPVIVIVDSNCYC